MNWERFYWQLIPFATEKYYNEAILLWICYAWARRKNIQEIQFVWEWKWMHAIGKLWIKFWYHLFVAHRSMHKDNQIRQFANVSGIFLFKHSVAFVDSLTILMCHNLCFVSLRSTQTFHKISFWMPKMYQM